MATLKGNAISALNDIKTAAQNITQFNDTVILSGELLTAAIAITALYMDPDYLAAEEAKKIERAMMLMHIQINSMIMSYTAMNTRMSEAQTPKTLASFAVSIYSAVDIIASYLGLDLNQ